MFVARRAFLFKIMAGLGFMGLPASVRHALAMGTKVYPQGVRKIEGNVKINEKPSVVSDPVKLGDVVTTGKGSMVVFVLDKGVYLLKDNSRLELTAETVERSKESVVNVLKMMNGKMLAVFREEPKQIFTKTAVLGIRGSGLYIEAELDRTYVCTCYGINEIQAIAMPGIREIVRAEHHEKPVYVYGSGEKELIVKAPVINHTDADLIFLESMLGRKPPFWGSTDFTYRTE
jgi:hypothetical protein